ncbi:MAG: universal stress protein [Candidatus Freyarchaeota archaeon]
MTYSNIAITLKKAKIVFSKVLYPTDFSEPCREVVEYLKKLKGAGTKEVIILERGGSLKECLDKMKNKKREEAEKEIEEIRKELEDEGISVRVQVESGVPYKKIIETAEKENVSLIVMGSHGKGVLKELLIGSVSENVVRHTKKPVMIIR